MCIQSRLRLALILLWSCRALWISYPAPKATLWLDWSAFLVSTSDYCLLSHPQTAYLSHPQQTAKAFLCRLSLANCSSDHCFCGTLWGCRAWHRKSTSSRGSSSVWSALLKELPGIMKMLCIYVAPSGGHKELVTLEYYKCGKCE